MDIRKHIASLLVFLLGFYILIKFTESLEIQFGSLILGLFFALGLAWFIKEVLNK